MAPFIVAALIAAVVALWPFITSYPISKYVYVRGVTYRIEKHAWNFDQTELLPIYKKMESGKVFRKHIEKQTWEIKRKGEWRTANFSHSLELDLYAVDGKRELRIYFDD